ncbi:MAG: AAA family ATPase, partial [Myxococcota bacterium]
MKIPYGVADFKTIRDNQLLYVDKSRYIRELE